MSCLLVPTTALDLRLLDLLHASIDYPIDHKIMVGNGRKGAVTEWAKTHPGWRVVNDDGSNLGVSGSWNLAPKLCPNEDSWLIVNDDVRFQYGCLKRVFELGEAIRTHPMICFVSDCFWAFIWTQMGLNRLGQFDENFWPAYYEDSEMKLRVAKANLKIGTLFPNEALATHGKMPPGGDFQCMIKGSEIFNREYFKRKWNRADHNGPSFPTPFNAPGMDLKFWHLEADRRKGMEPLWKAFMDTPNVSLYS